MTQTISSGFALIWAPAAFSGLVRRAKRALEAKRGSLDEGESRP